MLKNRYVGTDLNEYERWRHISKYPELRAPELFGSVTSKRFEDTINKNILYLENFIKEIYAFNPAIRICFTLIPRYVYMEKIEACYHNQWKYEFESIIKNICAKYQIKYLNYKNREEISNNNFFYYDVLHLNTPGGIAMTSILDNEIKKIVM